jgi:protein TonB
VLAAGGILLGAAALQSLLIRVPGPSSSNPHAITVDPKPLAATQKPWDEPSKSPTVKMVPAEPADPWPTGAVPDAPQTADHPIDPTAPPKPVNTESSGAETPEEPEAPAAAEQAKPARSEPKVETPPAELKHAPKPEPSQIATSEPETVPPPAPAPVPVVSPPMVEPQLAEQKPTPLSEPAKVAKAPVDTLEPVTAPSIADQKPVEEAKVETLPDEPMAAPQPEPPAAASDASEAKPEAASTPATPKTVTEETAPDAKSSEPPAKPAAVTKVAPREEKPTPKSTPAERPKETAVARTQGGGLFSKPMSLGFGRAAAKQPVSKVSSARYAANVRAAIGRHRPRVGGGGSATVAFSIGPGGGLQAVQIVRSSGKPAADQAAIATVRAAAPFPPPPPGAKSTFSIQIYFR